MKWFNLKQAILNYNKTSWSIIHSMHILVLPLIPKIIIKIL